MSPDSTILYIKKLCATYLNPETSPEKKEEIIKLIKEETNTL
jgi:hypothetical protein